MMRWMLALCLCTGIGCKTSEPEQVKYAYPPNQDLDHEGDKLVDELQRTKRGLELLAQFPLPKWNPHRAVVLSAKQREGKPITEEEGRFLKSFLLWSVGHAYYLKNKAGSDKSDDGDVDWEEAAKKLGYRPWEYKFLDLPVNQAGTIQSEEAQKVFNALSAQGWEFVQIVQQTVIFRRRRQ